MNVKRVVGCILVSGMWASSSALASPTELQQAIDCSEQNRDLAASFTLTLSRSGEDLVSERYNVETNEWSPIKGDIESLAKDAQAVFRQRSANLGRIGGLVPEEILATLKDPVLIEETADALVYSFVPGAKEGEDPMPPAMIEALDARLLVDRKTMCMSGLTMRALKSFKPAAIATIDYFEVDWEFDQPDGSPIPLVTAFRSHTKGRAMLKKFENNSVMRVSDIVIIP